MCVGVCVCVESRKDLVSAAFFRSRAEHYRQVFAAANAIVETKESTLHRLRHKLDNARLEYIYA